jgi:hypothetical protein
MLSHFARGIAQAARGDAAAAERERDAYREAMSNVAAEFDWGYNKAKNVVAVSNAVLDAWIARAKRDDAGAIEAWRKAVAAEDALSYDEPPDWYLPARESLGGLLLLDGQNEAAEQVFRADLRRRVRSGRSLFGLWESLKRQRQDYAAGLVEREFATAWRNADIRLRVEDL